MATTEPGAGVRDRQLSEIADAVSGRRAGPDVVVSRVVTDSREAGPGALFFALRGGKDDGHLHVTASFARGAAAVVVEEDPIPAGGPSVRVASTGDALLRLAAFERAAFAGSVVGITGSTGKTSTKDLAAAVLSTRMRVHASPASFNNQVGVPLTILGADPEAAALVCEVGAGVVGEIAGLAGILRPQIGVVTSVGVAHLETFGSPERIARAKAELVESLPPDGVVILNADDRVVRRFGRRTRARTVTFGLSPGADVSAEEVQLDDMGRARFVLCAGGEREPVELAVSGRHMVANALAASACGLALGVTVAECVRGLAGARVSRWRMEVRRRKDGVRILNDAYNANPVSMAAALRTARWMSRGGRLIAVLGTMAELGPLTRSAHEDVGALVVRLGVDRLVTVGWEARLAAEEAIRQGMPAACVSVYDEAAQALEEVRATARPRDLVLVKGSRAAGLERVAEGLWKEPPRTGWDGPAGDSTLDRIGNTPLRTVSVVAGRRRRDVHLKLEGCNPGGSIKDRTASSLVDSLERRGAVRPGSTLVESTSGNLGVGLALVCRKRGYPFVAVVDPKAPGAFLDRIASLGARIEIVDTPDEHGGFLSARLARVRELCVSCDRFVWTNQYSNPANPAAHFGGTGPEIVRQTEGQVDAAFVAVSTGGTLAGVGRYLRASRPAARVVAVDAAGSVVMGGPPGPRRLTGIGSSRRSDFILPELYDDRVIVSDAEAFAHCRALYEATGIMVGGSSGAVLAACMRYLAEHSEVTCPVCICADRGENYLETIYDDRWLESQGIVVPSEALRTALPRPALSVG